MWHRILTTKLLNDLILPSTQLYIPSQQDQEPTMQSLCTEILYRTEVHRLTYYCCSLPRGDETGQFLWILVARRRSKTGRWPPEAGPSPPETCQDHLLHQEARGAEARLAAAPLWLRRLSAEFEALSARRWASVSGWNSSTNFYKEFIYVYCILRTCLYKDSMDGVGIVLGISLHDLSYINKITLISCNGNYNIGWAVLPKLFYPIL